MWQKDFENLVKGKKLFWQDDKKAIEFHDWYHNPNQSNCFVGKCGHECNITENQFKDFGDLNGWHFAEETKPEWTKQAEAIFAKGDIRHFSGIILEGDKWEWNPIKSRFYNKSCYFDEQAVMDFNTECSNFNHYPKPEVKKQDPEFIPLDEYYDKGIMEHIEKMNHFNLDKEKQYSDVRYFYLMAKWCADRGYVLKWIGSDYTIKPGTIEIDRDDNNEFLCNEYENDSYGRKKVGHQLDDDYWYPVDLEATNKTPNMDLVTGLVETSEFIDDFGDKIHNVVQVTSPSKKEAERCKIMKSACEKGKEIADNSEGVTVELKTGIWNHTVTRKDGKVNYNNEPCEKGNDGIYRTKELSDEQYNNQLYNLPELTEESETLSRIESQAILNNHCRDLMPGIFKDLSMELDLSNPDNFKTMRKIEFLLKFITKD